MIQLVDYLVNDTRGRLPSERYTVASTSTRATILSNHLARLSPGSSITWLVLVPLVLTLIGTLVLSTDSSTSTD